MMIDTTPPETIFSNNELVIVKYKERKLTGKIVGEPYNNSICIVTYNVLIEGVGTLPRVHYLISKYN